MRHFIILILMLVTFAGCKKTKSLNGDAFFQQGNYEKAIELYGEQLKLNPRHVKTLYNRGRCYEELGMFEKAGADFERVLKIEPDHIKSTISLGKIEFMKEDYKTAISYFNLVTEKDPSNAMGYYLSGRCNHKMGMVYDAMKDYEMAIRLDRSMGDAYLYRGVIYISRDKKAQACNDFSMAKKCGSDDADELINKYCQ